MYEKVFNFDSRPFTSAPFVKHYFAAQAISQAYTQAQLCIDRAVGPVIVIGGTGTGKSLLLTMLAELYSEQFNVVNLACARLDQRSDLLQSILFELEQPYRDMAEGELRLALIDYLKPSEISPNGVLLLVDEAQTLNGELLDEVRLITNFVRDGKPRVRFVIAGSQRLEDSLTDPKLESFNQRIAARCYLTNLGYEETAAYIHAHIDRVGGVGDAMFPSPTTRVIFEVSDGCPRLINQVCDQALMLAAVNQLPFITEQCAQEAWRDAQNIPGSWPESGVAQTAGNVENDETWTVLEFGQLEDESSANDPDDVEAFEIANATEQQQFDPANEFDGEPIESPADDFEDVAKPLNVETIETTEAVEPTATAGVAAFGYGVGDEHVEPSNFVADSIDATEDETESRHATALEQNAEPSLDDQIISEDRLAHQSLEVLQNVENPFDEEFEQEELLVEQHLPFFAEQNRSSLTLTPMELESIDSPQSNITIEQLRADLLGEESSEVNTEANPESLESKDATLVRKSPITERVREDTVVSGDELAEGDDIAKLDSDDLSLNQAGTDTDFEANHFETAANDEESRGFVERRADEILDTLLVEDEKSASEQVVDPHQSQAPFSPAAIDDYPVVPFHEGPDPLRPGAESEIETPANEEILNEIEIQQQSNVESVSIQKAGTFDSPQEDCSVEHPIADHDSDVPVDDRDMIIVSHIDQSHSPKSIDDVTQEIMASQPSTGRAERMDYQDLFEQLRQIAEN